MIGDQICYRCVRSISQNRASIKKIEPLKIRLQILLIIEFLFTSTLFGQIESLNKIYTKIVFEEIEVRDTKGNIKTNDEIFDLFYQLDTAINCFGGFKEEFIENLYSSNGLLVVSTENEIDTIERSDAQSEIEFTKILRDDNGELLRIEKIFNANSSLLNDLSKPIDFNNSLNDERLLTKGNGCWVVDKIIYDKAEIYLDSCHSQYRLCFKNKLLYNQDFGGNIECETVIDEDRIKKGGFFRYWESEVRHTILFQEGIWKTKENKLYLTNKEGNWIKHIPYLFEGEKLILEPVQNYKIMLIKKPATSKD